MSHEKSNNNKLYVWNQGHVLRNGKVNMESRKKMGMESTTVLNNKLHMLFSTKRRLIIAFTIVTWPQRPLDSSI